MKHTLIVWASWLVLMAGANLATPLYAVYAQRYHFSSLVLTAIFATYAVVLVPSLILFGQLSDRIGRRPAILIGLAVSAVALLLFAFASSTAWLFGARALQGVAVGTISGAATAALVEFDPDGDRRRAAMFAGLAQAGGSGAGPLLAGALAQWAPEPLRLSFYVGLALTLVAAVGVMALPAGGSGEAWRIQRPNVPREIRSQFIRVSVTAGTVWASVALYLSIVPSLAGDVIGKHRLALISLVAAVALFSSFATQIVVRSHSQRVGLVVLAVGLVGLVVAGSLAVLVVGAVLTGLGHGIAFVDAQRELNEVAPDVRRGEVTAAFIAVIYAFVASAVIATGLLDEVFSLHAAVGAVAAVLLVVALVTAGARSERG